ncbi:hypothetical protein LQZ19_02985 [Treponema primitia]|uniref:hypothetical protein n=1 Tax=Treponema primitia TaxID=88058 RepID=UPI003981913F
MVLHCVYKFSHTHFTLVDRIDGISVHHNRNSIGKISEKHVSLFAWRTSDVTSLNGNGGKYSSLFGVNQIIVENIPKGRTVINVNAVFGLVEIIVSKDIKIINKTVPIFSGIFQPKITEENIDKDRPELYITGKAVFGNITIKNSRGK